MIYLFNLSHIRKSFQVSCHSTATDGFTLFHANCSNEIWTVKYVSKGQVDYLQLIDIFVDYLQLIESHLIITTAESAIT